MEGRSALYYLQKNNLQCALQESGYRLAYRGSMLFFFVLLYSIFCTNKYNMSIYSLQGEVLESPK